ncbi:hypothetical protein ABRQ22_12350 [Cellulosimicrobium sp. ES-005]|uniref:Uncharacterized protein n=1 Tax=Cellulosimicrobium sp. ES-005 TaxID=3163031 RepID=A0AAU8FWF0_9MICO
MQQLGGGGQLRRFTWNIAYPGTAGVVARTDQLFVRQRIGRFGNVPAPCCS